MSRKAEQTFAETLRRVSCEINETASVPVDIVKICCQFGVQIARASSQRERPLLHRVSSGYQITLPSWFVNAKDYWPIERFWIAHELGHAVLHREHCAQPFGKSEYWRHETLCNVFARKVLLPEHFAAPLMRSSHATPLDLYELAKFLARQAGVTWLTAGYRITDYISNIAFLDVRIVSESGKTFRVAGSTLKDGKIRGGIAASDEGFGKLLQPLLARCTRVQLNETSFKDASMLERYSALKGAESGLAVRSQQRVVRVVLQYSHDFTDPAPVDEPRHLPDSPQLRQLSLL